MSKLKKIYHIADVHIRNVKRHKEYRQVFEKMFEGIRNRGTEDAIIYLAGDIITFTQAMTLDASGRLGIGVTNPTAILDINSGANSPIIKLTSSAAGQIPFSIRANIPGFSNSGFSIYDETAAATRLVISSGGNVGIGTTSPNIVGVTGTVTTINTSTTNAYGGLELAYQGTSIASFLNNYNIGVILSSRTAIPLIFETGATERMRITSGGNVGIGTTAPATALGVQFADATTTQSNFQGIAIANSNTTINNGSAITFSHSAASINSFAKIGATFVGRAKNLALQA